MAAVTESKVVVSALAAAAGKPAQMCSLPRAVSLLEVLSEAGKWGFGGENRFSGFREGFAPPVLLLLLLQILLLLILIRP